MRAGVGIIVPRVVLSERRVWEPAREWDLVLVARKDAPDDWTIPGGSVELGQGESPRDAAVRELKEETGIEVLPSDLLEIDTVWRSYKGKSYFFTTFLLVSSSLPFNFENFEPAEGEAQVRWGRASEAFQSSFGKELLRVMQKLRM